MNNFFWFQHFLITILEKWKKNLEKSLCYGYVYLSKKLMNKKSGIVKSMWLFEKSARTNAQFT